MLTSKDIPNKTTIKRLRFIHIEDDHVYLNGQTSVCAKLPDNYTLGYLCDVVDDLCDKHHIVCPADADLEQFVNDALKHYRKEAGIYDMIESDFDIESTWTDAEIVHWFVSGCPFANVDGDLYRYSHSSGIYQKDGEQFVRRKLEACLPNISPRRKADIVNKIKDRRFTPLEVFDADINWLHVDNGWLDLESGNFEPHSPNRFSFHKLPVKFDPRAWCPDFVRFLMQVLMRDDVKPFIKMLGYILMRSAVYETGLIMVGEGRNGKSTLQTVIERWVGSGAVGHVSLQPLSDDRFAPAGLDGKMVNLVDDLDVENMVKNTSYIKTLISGKPLRAQKKYGQPYDFQNHAVFIIATNRIPDVKDKSYAWLRRWLVIEFTRVFEGHEVDPHLVDKLTTAIDLSGILNLALMGLRWLKEDGGFKETDMEELRKKYSENNSRIKGFINDECELMAGNDGYYVESSIFKAAHRRYCLSHGTTYYNEQELGRELKRLGVVNKQKMVHGGRAHYFFGIRLKSGSSLLNYSGKSPTFHKIGDKEGMQSRKNRAVHLSNQVVTGESQV